MYFIESERLKLIPLTHTQLQLLHKSRQELELSLGLKISSMDIDPEFQLEIEDALVNFWLPKTLENPENFEWFTSWEIVLKPISQVIGGIGFAGCPANGEAEIGFMLDKQQHHQGYAGEALSMMSDWAFQAPEVKALIAHTFSHNIPARKLLERNGFKLEKEEGDLLSYRK